METMLWWLVPCFALISLFFAFILYRELIGHSEGTDRMKEIAGFVKEGSRAYIRSQNKVILVVFLIIAAILAAMAFIGIQNPFVPLVFLTGGFFAGICTHFGMKTATNASARTAAACRESLNKGLRVAFRAGAVMGLLVVGFGLLAISLWVLILNRVYGDNWVEITNILLAFAMGASGMALFARVGGGIYTKAADIGADLVGKVEAGMPEDDPRNPAVIADNVGDNVGDVVGMGTDLYETYCGAILATSAVGASLAMTHSGGVMLVFAPMIVAAIGIPCSIIGMFLVRTNENSSQKQLLTSLLIGTGASSLMVIIGLALLSWFQVISWGTFGAIMSGLVAGVIIGQASEYYTSSNYRPTKRIAEQGLHGPATNILSGMATGMMSTGIPVFVIGLAIICSYLFAGGFTDVSAGIYGVAFSAIGMLSTLAIQLATVTFASIADNAGGNAEMSGLPKEVRERTDALDALGNTTAATGKGFAIGAASLTAVALITAYLDTVHVWLGKLAAKTTFFVGNMGFTNQIDQVNFDQGVILVSTLDMPSLVEIFQLNVLNPKLLVGIFIGSVIVFIYCSLTISAVGRAASEMVAEVRRQFKENPGIIAGTAKPDYSRCVGISTQGALKAMVLPASVVIVSPLIVGMLLHVAGVVGLLIGGLTTGLSMALMLNNSGGAWDNAKKYIEAGEHGGKGTDAHKAAVIGDTVGDPFKDTAGPSLNILIKLTAIVSLVFAGLILKFGIFF